MTPQEFLRSKHVYDGATVYDRSAKEATIEVAELLEEYASMKVSEASGFISVKDRLPETEDNVLAILDGKVCVMRYFSMEENDETYMVWGYVYDGLDGDAIYDEDYYPTDWMPIPKKVKN